MYPGDAHTLDQVGCMFTAAGYNAIIIGSDAKTGTGFFLHKQRPIIKLQMVELEHVVVVNTLFSNCVYNNTEMLYKTIKERTADQVS